MIILISDGTSPSRKKKSIKRNPLKDTSVGNITVNNKLHPLARVDSLDLLTNCSFRIS